MTPAPSPPPAPGSRRLGWWLLAVAAVAVGRLVCLDADPSAAMPDPTIMDEGLWADSARGRLWFAEGYFADDLGNAYLAAPLYTWSLMAIYQVLGIGLWQTRLLSALASIGTAALAGAVVGRRHGTRAAAITTAILGLCPLLDQHGRFALLESTQSFWLLLSFALLFPSRPMPWKAALAGAAMGAAMLVKPNSATFGVLPFAVAFASAWRSDHASAVVGAARRRMAEAAAAVLGGAIVLGILGLPVWLAHWGEFWTTLEYESGAANWTLGDHLLRLGLVGAREQSPGHHRLWALLRHAPLCTLGVWLLLLRRAGGLALPDWRGTRPLWIWLAVGMIVNETSYDHVARRQVLLLPAMAMLCAIALVRRDRKADAVQPWPVYVRWLLLLSVPVLICKPIATATLASWFTAAGATHERGIAALLGGVAVLAGTALLPLLLRSCGATPDRCHRLVVAVLPSCLAAAAALEAIRLGALPPHEYTVRAAQQHFGALVAKGEIALGDHAATLLQGQHVRTVRRVLVGERYSSPRPNPDVAERLRPRYVIDYRAPPQRQFRDLTEPDFEVIGEVGFLREPSGANRFELQLWRRR